MKLKPIDEELILKLITKENASPLYVAKEMSIGAQRVYNLLFEKGYKEYIPMPTQDVVNNIIELYTNGVCVNDIVKRIHEPKYKVTYALKLNGYNPVTRFHYQRENKVDHHFFDNIDTEAKAYFLGFLYADGSLNYSTNKYQITLALKNSDAEILTRLKDEIKSTWDIANYEYVREDGKISHKSYLSVYSKDLCEALKKAGCPQTKTYILKFPDETVVPKSLQHHFIRGYFDGDGSVYWLKKVKTGGPSAGWNFQGTECFLSGLKEVFMQNEMQKGAVRHGHGNVYEFKSAGIPTTLKLMEFLYKNATIYLQRKFKIFIEIKDYYSKKHSRATKKLVA